MATLVRSDRPHVRIWYGADHIRANRGGPRRTRLIIIMFAGLLYRRSDLVQKRTKSVVRSNQIRASVNTSRADRGQLNLGAIAPVLISQELRSVSLCVNSWHILLKYPYTPLT